MAIPIKIPDVGTSVDEVTLVKWRKQKGDFIRIGEVIAEIETDKAIIELESVAEGKILEILFNEGESVREGTIIAYVGEEGENIQGMTSKISPSLKNLAMKLNVDISQIKSSSPDGVITRDDILKAAREKKARSDLAQEKHSQEVSPHQKTIIKKVMKSHLEIPSVHFVASINMDNVMDLRKLMIEKNKIKIFYDAFFVFSCARCIRKIPVMNSFISGEKIEKKHEISIAVAVAYQDRLFTPVIPSADKKTLVDISIFIDNMIRKIEQGSISPQEMEGACFLVSNLGMYPVEQFNTIVYPGHSGALAIGKISKMLVVENDKPVIRNICKVTLSCDHRIINGSTAGEFLKELKETMEIGKFAEEC